MVEDPADTPRPLAEISHGPSAFEAFLDRNQKGMIALGVLLAVAGGAWIVMKGVKESAAKAAGAALSKAESLAELQEVPAKHPETAAAGSAAILISSEQWEAGEQDAAIETLRKFISENPEHPALPTARASLATRLMQYGKTDEAISLFRDLADAPGSRYIAPYALMSLGDIHKAAGRKDEAEDAYKRAVEGYRGNPFANLADQHLKLVNFKMPEEIEAPAPAVPPSGSEIEKPEMTPGAALPGELKDNPLGDILNGEGATPAPPAEEMPSLPGNGQDSAKPGEEDPEKPAPVLPEGEEEKPEEKPPGGESN